MNQAIMPLSLNGDTFEGLKKDFDQILHNTLTNMQTKNADSAELNIKLKISTKKENNATQGQVRTLTIPSFEHSVQSILQIKNKKGGSMGGNYELVLDEQTGDYVMKFISDGQVSLYEEEEEFDYNILNVEPEEQVSHLQGQSIPALMESTSNLGEEPDDEYDYDEMEGDSC